MNKYAVSIYDANDDELSCKIVEGEDYCDALILSHLDSWVDTYSEILPILQDGDQWGAIELARECELVILVTKID